MIQISQSLKLLLHANQLKRTARTGWVQRGVPEAENVAAHSYGVVFTALVLAQIVEEPVEIGRLLAMAALHDLPEALTTDIPTPAWRYLPAGVKEGVERGAMGEMLSGVAFAPALMELWEALQRTETAESRLVHDADKLEMYLQAYVYQQHTGNRQLAEFWQKHHRFHFPQAQAIYEELRAAMA